MFHFVGQGHQDGICDQGFGLTAFQALPASRPVSAWVQTRSGSGSRIGCSLRSERAPGPLHGGSGSHRSVLVRGRQEFVAQACSPGISSLAGDLHTSWLGAKQLGRQQRGVLLRVHMFRVEGFGV